MAPFPAESSAADSVTESDPLHFTCALLDALPERSALYVQPDDRLITNRRWNREIGQMSVLGDLARVGLDVERLQEALSASSAAAIYPATFECTHNGEAGAAEYLTLHVSAVGEHPGVVCFVLKDESVLRRVEQMRKDFIANVSHELRTPLTAVKGYLETLLDPAFFSLERVQEFLPTIFEHTERLHNLMLDLLSLSRLERPGMRIELEPLTLRDELRDAIGATAPLARLKNIAVELQPIEEELRVLGNSDHIERILVNLLDNAIKYSPRGGFVRISAERNEDFAWVHVADDGLGIAPEDLPRVFERFYRTSGALSGRQRGSGLGLAIVKHIVQQLGGVITASSELGEGSTFSFSLRLA